MASSSAAVLDPPLAPIWRLAAASLLTPQRRPHADIWLRRLPMTVIILAQVLLTLRLNNTAFQDEALYINGGHALLGHWLHGTPAGNPGDFYSGAPAAYPVIAALLDNVGGLWLVRMFSLVCMVATTVLIRSLTARIFHSPQAGLLAAAAFVVCGPVMFLGGFATFDAVCVWCLALALWIGVRGNGSMLSSIAMGTALAAAATFKYTGAAFIPPVLFIVFLVNGARGRALIRTGVAAVSTVTLLGLGLLVWGRQIERGIKFTTTSRKALFPAPAGQLLGYVAQDIGLIFLLAIVGVFLVPRRPRLILMALAMLAAACILPASQLRLGEAVSFEKHLAYSALFLAPLAGVALSRLSRRGPRFLGVFAMLFIITVTGLSRSMSMYTLWPDVARVVQIITPDAPAGKYLSTSSDALAYYTKQSIPAARWDSQYGLFGAGPVAIRHAVADHDYQYVIFRSGPSGNATEDANMNVLKDALDHNAGYQLAAAPFQTRQYALERWYIYKLK